MCTHSLKGQGNVAFIRSIVITIICLTGMIQYSKTDLMDLIKMTHCTTPFTKTTVWHKAYGKINLVILVDHCTALNCVNAAAPSHRRYAVCTFINPGSPRKPRRPMPSVIERALLNLLKFNQFCQLRIVTPERPITSTVRLLIHVLCKPTHFFFNSLIPTHTHA